MDTSFYPLLYVIPKRITATVPEWKVLLKLLPPGEEVLPLFEKIAGSARFFTSDRLLNDYRSARLPIVCSAFNRNVGGTRNVTISLPVELAALLKELGGSHWIRDRLREVQKAGEDRVQ